jgi:hypothetical protein
MPSKLKRSKGTGFWFVEPARIWPAFTLPALSPTTAPEATGAHSFYRLRWSGQMPHHWTPAERRTRVAQTRWHDGDHLNTIGDITRKLAVQRPEQLAGWSEDIAYWLAVNASSLHLDPAATPLGLEELPAVAGMPAARVFRAVDRIFRLDQAAIRAEAHVAWLAHSHWDNELFRPFDTAVRDELAQIAVGAVRVWFKFLSDYLWDVESQRFEPGETKAQWARDASYLFWVGRVGKGLYLPFSNITAQHLEDSVQEHFVTSRRRR